MAPIWWRQVYQNCGNPCMSSTIGPSPSSATWKRAPFAETSRWVHGPSRRTDAASDADPGLPGTVTLMTRPSRHGSPGGRPLVERDLGVGGRDGLGVLRTGRRRTQHRVHRLLRLGDGPLRTRVHLAERVAPEQS